MTADGSATTPRTGRRPRVAGALLGVALAAAAGCGKERASVEGTITLDGTPLDGGNISFVPRDADQRQAGWSVVTGGKYAIPPTAGLGTGAFRVEVRAARATGEKSPDPDVTATKEVVPAAYNARSELTADIKPGPNVVNFDLKSK
jgi:hypothetical protein